MSSGAAKRERGFRRFVVALMHSPFTLPMLGASVLVAVVLGVHLGESSVGLINPIYFQGAPLHPRDRGAAIEEGSLHRSQTAYADLYGWEQGHAARAADCGNCEALRARDAYAYSAQVPYFGGRQALRTAVVEARDDLGERFAEVPEDLSPRVSDIERYAHYPVSEDADEPEVEMALAAEQAEFAEATPFEGKKPDQE